MSQQLIPRANVPAYMESRFGVSYSAKYLGILAHRGEGPRYHRVGKFALYSPDDIDEWIADRTSPALRRASEILLAK